MYDFHINQDFGIEIVRLNADMQKYSLNFSPRASKGLSTQMQTYVSTRPGKSSLLFGGCRVIPTHVVVVSTSS